jgi:hypothetical protein
VLFLPAITAAVQPRAVLVGAAVWIGVSNAGSGTLRACVGLVGEEHGREGAFNTDLHACRADDQFVALRTGDSYLFLYSRTGRRSSRYSLDVYLLEGTGSPARVVVKVIASTKLKARSRPKVRALKVVQVDNQIIIENSSDSPLAIATETNGCADSDRSKMLVLGHNRITLATQFGLDEIAIFDPAKPCKRIGSTTIRRRQSE